MPRRLKPTNPIAADAILVGDPGRALMLAQELLENPLMSNHARGLWGYSAATPQGHPLTVQSTGMGGPSAATVLSDLWRLGLRRAIRVGSCVALDPGLEPGQVLVVERAVAGDGTSQALLGAVGEVSGEVQLTAALRSAARGIDAVPGLVESVDLAPGVLDAVGREPAAGVSAPAPSTGLDADETPQPEPSGRGCLTRVSDLQTAALLALGEALDLPVAALLVVEGSADEEERMKKAGRAAAAALSEPQP